MVIGPDGVGRIPAAALVVAAGSRPQGRAELGIAGAAGGHRGGHRRLPPRGDGAPVGRLPAVVYGGGDWAQRAPRRAGPRRRAGPVSRRAACATFPAGPGVRGTTRWPPSAPPGSPRRLDGGARRVRRPDARRTGWRRTKTSTARSLTASRGLRPAAGRSGVGGWPPRRRAARGGAGGRELIPGGEMRVRSPIGDLPYTVTGVRRGGAGIVVDGELGAWSSQIEIGPATCRCSPGAAQPLVAAAVLGAAALLLARRRSRRPGRHRPGHQRDAGGRVRPAAPGRWPTPTGPRRSAIPGRGGSRRTRTRRCAPSRSRWPRWSTRSGPAGGRCRTGQRGRDRRRVGGRDAAAAGAGRRLGLPPLAADRRPAGRVRGRRRDRAHLGAAARPLLLGDQDPLAGRERTPVATPPTRAGCASARWTRT